jgi:exosortase D (VPLPA-CTERM-specific)
MVIRAESTPVDTRSVPLAVWLWLGAGIVFAAVVARDGVSFMVERWLTLPEYSHGMLIPLIAAFLVWRRRDSMPEIFTGATIGLAVVAAGLALWLLGKLSTINAVSQYALVVMLYGLVIASIGLRMFATLWAPMLMLLLAIPLPAFAYNNLSSQLQLVSSALGVWLMRLCGTSVYLSGNVIDLGHFQMQVVEACDGLRYLFPLMTIGFIVAYFFRAPLWQRLLVFLSSIPITIGMNGLRIAMIGVFADMGNRSLAEGLLHDIQGWAMFMVSGALLLAESWLLVKLFSRGARWQDVLAFDVLPPVRRVGGAARLQTVPLALVGAASVLAVAAALSYAMPQRVELTPARKWFVDFPLALGAWHGRQGRIEDVYLDALKLDDYLMADFVSGTGSVNLYAAYYASQRQGDSIHSPRSCIPGGGWRITQMSQVDVPGSTAGNALRVNRAVIELGTQRQLVYYWFKQRDRELTNEYAVKWYIFVDALARQRTDGALVRLITALQPGEDIALADRRLGEFANTARAELGAFLPD